jgi:hypothetical protein
MHAIITRTLFILADVQDDSHPDLPGVGSGGSFFISLGRRFDDLAVAIEDDRLPIKRVIVLK